MPSACNSFQTPIASLSYLREADDTTRPTLERFIARRFRETYDAHIQSFMPRLFGLYRIDGELLCAFGLRPADRQPLFLERYLDASIESFVTARAGAPISRRRIVEIGNLAGAAAGTVRHLILLLAERLHFEGFDWVAFTGVGQLCNSFSRLGLPLTIISQATVGRLDPVERQLWGRYYDKPPSVMLGDIAKGRIQLRSRTRVADGNVPVSTRRSRIVMP